MSPNNTLHSDGPRVARPADEHGRWASHVARSFAVNLRSIGLRIGTASRRST
jgi:hypothetical protein